MGCCDLVLEKFEITSLNYSQSLDNPLNYRFVHSTPQTIPFGTNYPLNYSLTAAAANCHDDHEEGAVTAVEVVTAGGGT